MVKCTMELPPFESRRGCTVQVTVLLEGTVKDILTVLHLYETGQMSIGTAIEKKVVKP